MLTAGDEVEKHLGRAAELQERACDGGIAASCGLLAAMYADGLADAEGRREGRVLLRQGLHRRRRHELRAARAMTRDGRGVARDPARAVSLARKSCDAGLAAACVALATALRTGDGVAADPAQSLALFTKGCEGGEPRGCLGQGELVRDGAGGATRDLARAARALPQGLRRARWERAATSSARRSAGAGASSWTSPRPRRSSARPAPRAIRAAA